MILVDLCHERLYIRKSSSKKNDATALMQHLEKQKMQLTQCFWSLCLKDAWDYQYVTTSPMQQLEKCNCPNAIARTAKNATTTMQELEKQKMPPPQCNS